MLLLCGERNTRCVFEYGIITQSAHYLRSVPNVLVGEFLNDTYPLLGYLIVSPL